MFGATTKALSRLHLPIARVALEFVLRYVVSEWGVPPKTDAWPVILDDSLAVCRIRRAPNWAIASARRGKSSVYLSAERVPPPDGARDATADQGVLALM